MLFRLLKFPARLAFYVYCRQIRINQPDLLRHKGPLLIASNHPNSFLDAIVLATLFRKPVYSLTRGDMFKKPILASLLRAMNMLPVYRTSEGVENMGHNYSTFDSCKEIFRQNGIVLIFSEGSCVNEWHLRPLKKGTARLALSSWKEGIPLKVLPTGINYNSFTSFGKQILLQFGKEINSNDLKLDDPFGRSVTEFNTLLEKRLQPLVLEIANNDKETIRRHFTIESHAELRALLFLPAMAGYFLHWPLYSLAKKISHKTGGHNDHYDSILVSMLFISYPLYLVCLCLLLGMVVSFPWNWSGLMIFPLLARTSVRYKQQYT